MSSKKAIKLYKRLDFKLTVFNTCAFLLMALCICTFLYFRLEHTLLKEIDRFLADETRELMGYFYNYDSVQELELIQKGFDKEILKRKFYPLYYRILNAEGKVIFGSQGTESIKTSFDDHVVKNALKRKATTDTLSLPGQRHIYLVRSTPIFIEDHLTYIIQIATHLKFIEKTMNNFLRNILVAIGITLLFGALGGWLLARRGLSPISTIIKATNQITATSLTQRLLSPHSGDEIDHLVSTINDMIARLDDSFRKMAQFTADVAHELRSPLCSLKGETEVTLSQERSSVEYHSVLARNLETFNSLNKMIEDLLLLSKVDAGEKPLVVLTPLRLDKLIVNLYDLFKVLADQKSISFTLPHIEDVELKGDKTKLQQLFSNFIDNAIKYTPSGGTIKLSLRNQGEQVHAVIEDSGIGMRDEDLPYIFERFYRVDKSRSKATGGTGLGLSICRWIVEAHQGKIMVKSELGKGSTFTIILPKSFDS
jgi:heavy metal sensor kinase